MKTTPTQALALLRHRRAMAGPGVENPTAPNLSAVFDLSSAKHIRKDQLKQLWFTTQLGKSSPTLDIIYVKTSLCAHGNA